MVSLATAHYEATTNAAFLIYLIAQDGPNHDELITLTLEEVEKQLNLLSNEVHDRDINFIMLEVPKEPKTVDDKTDKILNIEDNFFMNMNLKSKKKLTTFTQITP